MIHSFDRFCIKTFNIIKIICPSMKYKTVYANSAHKVEASFITTHTVDEQLEPKALSEHSNFALSREKKGLLFYLITQARCQDAKKTIMDLVDKKETPKRHEIGSLGCQRIQCKYIELNVVQMGLGWYGLSVVMEAIFKKKIGVLSFLVFLGRQALDMLIHTFGPKS